MTETCYTPEIETILKTDYMSIKKKKKESILIYKELRANVYGHSGDRVNYFSLPPCSLSWKAIGKLSIAASQKTLLNEAQTENCPNVLPRRVKQPGFRESVEK